MVWICYVSDFDLALVIHGKPASFGSTGSE